MMKIDKGLIDEVVRGTTIDHSSGFFRNGSGKDFDLDFHCLRVVVWRQMSNMRFVVGYMIVQNLL